MQEKRKKEAIPLLSNLKRISKNLLRELKLTMTVA
jgi:hypothetical protein